ncbi:RagB/SusD family nutrient uptake outer membrane protein [Flavobacterium tructae]|uniref:RagB/SusD family nutrient uptake outer membrane protein n=1 Tax=Flavobacterium tructae TaxID=1114873 RepID=A0A1S1J2G5_9FLAO|nr:RagB/SusD family nutrient uptake outer membrane protein [Flavobacterium tructae]OHT43649.1 starch-binding protein [Flavobacterium tructae]OXB15879.1 RagB/SusD family nutrient uptake outer membrane protein [Flavobacterium tructae]
MKKSIEVLQTGFCKTNNRFRKLALSAVLALIFFNSCDNFVEVDLPKSQLTSDAVFEDAETANAAMAGLYTKLRMNGILAGSTTGLSSMLGLYTDEFNYYQPNSVSNLFNNSLTAGTPQISDIWNQSYNQIYTANSIIEGVQRSTSITQDQKNHLMGEALFVRAMLHFTLTDIYGDIPYVTTTDYTTNSKISKAPTDQIYQNALKDLNTASDLLPEKYISNERIRPNRSAAKALLARLYLYMKLYPEASNAASAVINNTLYKKESNLDRIFLKGSTETIWQLMPGTAGANTQEGDLYIFKAGPPPIVGLREEFINAFEPTDKRKTHWTAMVSNGNQRWYYAYKYKQDQPTASSLEYSVVLRLAEQYLIRAEARAFQGDLTGAKEDLNVIRNAAGLSNAAALSFQDIMIDILQQRRFELFTEFGQRFFDLKRFGKLDKTLSPLKPGWDANDRLWPIPVLELNSNPNLNPQNQGY